MFEVGSSIVVSLQLEVTYCIFKTHITDEHQDVFCLFFIWKLPLTTFLRNNWIIQRVGLHLFIDIKIFLPEVSTANGTHSNKQTRFSMHQDDFTFLYNILLQLVELPYNCNITSYTRLISQWFPYTWHIRDKIIWKTEQTLYWPYTYNLYSLNFMSLICTL